jgi:hypothetical protein
VPHTPGFPVGLGGAAELHAAFLKESRTRDYGWCRVQEIRVSDPFLVRCGIPLRSRVIFRPSLIPQLSMHPWGEGSRFAESHIWRKVRARIWGTHGPLVQENPQVRFLHTFAGTAEVLAYF